MVSMQILYLKYPWTNVEVVTWYIRAAEIQQQELKNILKGGLTKTAA